ncbi:hypothetical protein EW145_g3528 [Phellinidium pouzarii]|uniref:GLTSCR protein conserved domain-containing protein n=1 Tax=Phellinidium pouzarii TaxID=167371 RepID=A0A4S4L8B7_9AGAM|nr:hypothetical protein EW145_g3528 [Phellinidium pouzarii]
MAVWVTLNRRQASSRMSSEALSSFSSVPQKSTWSWKIQNFATPQTYAAKSVDESKWQPATTSVNQQLSASTSTSTNNSRDAAARLPRGPQASRKRRRLNKEEEEIRDETAACVSANLTMDQITALYPDADTPFEDEVDVIKRLLPYHIYQHPQHDLDEVRGLKGKSKATEVDLLREEVKETRFALECHKRFRALKQRMKRARQKPGQHPVPLGQAIALERLVIEADHSVTSALEQELSSARSELDKILRVQRAAKTSSNRTTMTSNQSSPYYGYTTPTFGASSTPNFSNYYGSYTYPYGQSFLPGVTYTAPTKYSSSIPGASSFQTNAVPRSQPTYTPTSVATSSMTDLGSTSPAAARPPPVAIPLQLPVSALPALQSLGILPVPKASLPPPTESQPAAVLLGSSSNGSMLSLEINAALLQAPQMSGLAILLSSLVKLSGSSAGNVPTSAQTKSVDSGVDTSSISSGGAAPQGSIITTGTTQGGSK